jgi:hypothetical protein
MRLDAGGHSVLAWPTIDHGSAFAQGHLGSSGPTAGFPAMIISAVDAVRLFGGAANTMNFPVEPMTRDANIAQIYEGTNQIQRVVMARALPA